MYIKPSDITIEQKLFGLHYVDIYVLLNIIDRRT